MPLSPDRRFRWALLLALAGLCLPARAVQIGEAAPALAEGAAPRGQVVLVDFWASWCAPCQQAMPQYERLLKARAGRGLAVVGVNLDRDRAAADAALRRSGISFPILFDPQGAIAARYALPAMPTAYLIGRDGHIRNIHEGFRAGDLPQLEALIDRALGEPPP